MDKFMYGVCVLGITISASCTTETGPKKLERATDVDLNSGDTGAAKKTAEGDDDKTWRQDILPLSKHAPAWVMRGSGLFVAEADTPMELVAVASVKGVHNLSLARQSAGNRARAKLVAMLKQRHAGVLRGVNIVGHWKDADGRVFAMARMVVSDDNEATQRE